MNWYYVVINDNWAKPSRAHIFVEADSKDEASIKAKEFKQNGFESGETEEVHKRPQIEDKKDMQEHIKKSCYNVAFTRNGEKIES